MKRDEVLSILLLTHSLNYNYKKNTIFFLFNAQLSANLYSVFRYDTSQKIITCD